jgi:FkbM family methyltransferase
MPSYSRAQPSPRYRELIELYGRMHTHGEQKLGIPAEKTFPGTSLAKHVPRIKRLIERTGARTILDYGAGKGLQYRPQKVVVDGEHVADGIGEYWDVDEVRCFDPGYAPHSALPEGKFDAVVSTDVLEHCPEEDLPWILDEIFGYADRFVYLNVACFPARKTLPNGENAHITVRPPQWWRELVGAHATTLWELHAAHYADGPLTESVFRSASEESMTDAVLDGHKARFYTPNEVTRWRVQTLYQKEPVTIQWLRTMPEGAVFADVGANVGMYTVFAALVRAAQVVAFEPESRNYRVLNENLRLNHLQERVLALCAALSDRSGVERLYLSEVGEGASCHSLGEAVGFDLKPRASAFVQGAVALRFDELALPCPDYIKIDVDGFEHKVIGGMEKTLREAKVRSLLVELNPSLAEHREMRSFLEKLGFAWDAAQVAASARTEGPFKGVAEHVFRR